MRISTSRQMPSSALIASSRHCESASFAVQPMRFSWLRVSIIAGSAQSACDELHDLLRFQLNRQSMTAGRHERFAGNGPQKSDLPDDGTPQETSRKYATKIAIRDSLRAIRYRGCLCP